MDPADPRGTRSRAAEYIVSSVMVRALFAALFLAPMGAAYAQLSCSAPQKPMIEVELMFGRNIGGRLGVTNARWAAFLAREVTPRFPDGLTVFDTSGQWRDARKKSVVREPSKIVRIIMPADAQANEKIEAIASAYKKQFRQDSVGVLTRPACVSF
jgi:uncharacterized protein DUF3574